MPPPVTKKPPQKPRQQTIDIYNSTSTGHQVGSGVSKPTSWHKSRASKLQQQFRNHPFIEKTTEIKTTTVTARSPVVAKFPQALENPNLQESTAATAGPVTTRACTSDPQNSTNEASSSLFTPMGQLYTPTIRASTGTSISTSTAPAPTTTPTQFTPTTATKIFTNCTIYVNGTTAPAISDLVLKRYLCNNGASIATMLARKSVTHVILGKPSSAGGAGGGLAAGKLQKELTKSGRPIKYVSVQWALDSIKAGKRLPETNYTVMNMHGQSQRSIKCFSRAPSGATTNTDNTDKGNSETTGITATPAQSSSKHPKQESRGTTKG